MNHESGLWFGFFLILLAGAFIKMMPQQKSYLRRLERKLDALLKAQGAEWPVLSSEVQNLALNPRKKIAAIKLHREENPGFSIAEAKAEVEAFAAKNH